MAAKMRRVQCELCRKYMTIRLGSGRYLPLEVQMYRSFGGEEKPLWYYECPGGHACAWFIPAFKGEEELLVKRHFRVSLDQVLP